MSIWPRFVIPVAADSKSTLANNSNAQVKGVSSLTATTGGATAAPKKKKQPYPFWLGGTSRTMVCLLWLGIWADDPSEWTDPAVKGTTGILESATKFGGPQLKRIAITSSCAAVSNHNSTGLLDESSFNEGNIIEIREKGRDAIQVRKYRISKSLVEKTTWKYYQDHKSSISWDLVVLNPPFVFGPILHKITSASQLNTNLFGEWIDVRDVALGHVRAIEVEEAGGSRFIISGGAFINQDFYDIVNELKIPGVDAPKGTPGKGKDFAYTIRYDVSKARKVLGIEFRDKTTTTTKDTIEDFKARGWLN
ncbi:D-lactaldehyde dehydrogenase [Pyrrhoderma noxium]|uniref:D-lactaldehyde dehydrogenase n=1 Tax=Pyrrhoderma noxium TaxID=2282107 RepID=A0A286UDK5_9AGAM|nr:D-lactaldehyde dehydrogenase [Pyrrhoderma noxium]